MCVYAICRNESKFIKSWYQSMSEADYVCVLDTGSDDDTYEQFRKIAEYDSKLYLKQKIFDNWRFDKARNESMQLIPDDANILVCTDLDEVFEPGWANVLREKWEEDTERAWYKYTWSHDENGNELRTFIYDKIHSVHWHWEYPVHETLVNQFGDNTSTNCKVLKVFDEIHLHHYPDQTKSRASYLPLLEERKEEYPNDYYGRIYLAQEYSYRNFHRKSNEEFAGIMQQFKGRMTSIEKASCHLFSGENFLALGDYRKAKEQFEQGIKCDPSIRECYLGLAEIYLSEEKYHMCINTVLKCINNTYRHYSWLERDKSWTTQPWDILCLAYYRSCQQKESILCAAKALQYSPQDGRLKQNVISCVEFFNEKELVSLLQV